MKIIKKEERMVMEGQEENCICRIKVAQESVKYSEK